MCDFRYARTCNEGGSMISVDFHLPTPQHGGSSLEWLNHSHTHTHTHCIYNKIQDTTIIPAQVHTTMMGSCYRMNLHYQDYYILALNFSMEVCVVCFGMLGDFLCYWRLTGNRAKFLHNPGGGHKRGEICGK